MIAFKTGFFPAAASREDLPIVPDEGEVNALDVAGDPAFNGQLHPSLGFGRFELWPSLGAALGALGAALADAAARGVEELDEDAAVARRLAVCERGALLFLRRVLLGARGGGGLCPAFEWAQRAPRTCPRFGEAHANFAHTDLRLGEGLRMYNVWVPVRAVESEPLLLGALGPACAYDWRRARDRAHHLPRDSADVAWYFFGGMRVGEAVIFPGDGGGGERGIFHASAWPTSGARASFDSREIARLDASDEDAERARARCEREREAWEAEASSLRES